MKLLLVTYTYSPRVSPRAFRWGSVTAEWARRGVDVTVLTSGHPGEPARRTRAGVEVIRVDGRVDRVRRRLAGMRETGGRPGRGRRGRFTKVLRRIYRGTLRRVQWPDFSWPWIWPAFRAARKALRESEYDAVITSSYPFTAHLVGLALQRIDPTTRWVADIGDPFSFTEDSPLNNYALYARLNRYVEKHLLERSNVSVVTCRGTRRLYLGEWPHLDPKVVVIPPVVPSDVEANQRSQNASVDAKYRPLLRLIYVGAVYSVTRDPRPAVEAFDRLAARNSDLASRLTVDLYGKAEGIFDSDKVLTSPDISVRHHGAVSREEALRLQMDADVLMSFGNSNSFQLPSKIVELMALEKPILHFAATTPDEPTEMLRGHPLAASIPLVTRRDREAAPARLETFLLRVLESGIRDEQAMRSFAREQAERYSTRVIAQRYLELVQ